MKSYYITYGGVRGDCGHRHRTIEGAAKCLESDQKGCNRQGGYSDRSVRRMLNGEEVDLSAVEREALAKYFYHD